MELYDAIMRILHELQGCDASEREAETTKAANALTRLLNSRHLMQEAADNRAAALAE